MLLCFVIFVLWFYCFSMDVKFDIVFIIEIIPHFKLNISYFIFVVLNDFITRNHTLRSNPTAISIWSRRFFSFVLGQNISDITNIYMVNKLILFFITFSKGSWYNCIVCLWMCILIFFLLSKCYYISNWINLIFLSSLFWTNLFLLTTTYSIQGQPL